MTSITDLARKAGATPHHVYKHDNGVGPVSQWAFSESDLSRFAALHREQVIAELCEGVGPVAWQHIQGEYVEASSRQLDDHELAHGWVQEPLYPASTVAALKARVAELETALQRLVDNA